MILVLGKAGFFFFPEKNLKSNSSSAIFVSLTLYSGVSAKQIKDHKRLDREDKCAQLCIYIPAPWDLEPRAPSHVPFK